MKRYDGTGMDIDRNPIEIAGGATRREAVFLDTETTGLKKRDEVIEIAVVDHINAVSWQSNRLNLVKNLEHDIVNGKVVIHAVCAHIANTQSNGSRYRSCPDARGRLPFGAFGGKRTHNGSIY